MKPSLMLSGTNYTVPGTETAYRFDQQIGGIVRVNPKQFRSKKERVQARRENSIA